MQILFILFFILYIFNFYFYIYFILFYDTTVLWLAVSMLSDVL